MVQLSKDNKRYYSQAHDRITVKRFNSPYVIRRTAHREMYQSIIDLIEPGKTILDAGCGEGTLSILLAKAGFNVVGVDLSEANVASARAYAEREEDLSGTVRFEIGDAENLPFSDNSFDYVVSNHVLEHLPSFEKGLSEIKRVTKKYAVVGIPTCLNPASWALLGGDTYWKLGKKSVFAVPLGALRVLWAGITSAQGVNEGYGKDKKQIHIFRFPSVFLRLAAECDMDVKSYCAQTIPIPYINISFSSLAKKNYFRNLGLGTVYLLEKSPKN